MGLSHNAPQDWFKCEKSSQDAGSSNSGLRGQRTPQAQNPAEILLRCVYGRWKYPWLWILSCPPPETWEWALVKVRVWMTVRGRTAEGWTCLHRGSSESPGVLLNTPRWGCSGCPTSPDHTVYRGRVSCTESWVGDGIGREGCGPGRAGRQWQFVLKMLSGKKLRGALDRQQIKTYNWNKKKQKKFKGRKLDFDMKAWNIFVIFINTFPLKCLTHILIRKTEVKVTITLKLLWLVLKL